MKRIGFVSCFLGLIGLMGLTGCQRTPEERIIGYLDDVVQIVVDTTDCEKAAKDIEKYTETKKGRIKDDIKAVIVRTKDDKNSSKELKKRLEKQWDELKDNAQDSIQPLLKAIGNVCGCTYGTDEKTDIAMRVIADHIRTIAFAITDGQLPGNAKAGYVIRRILRRAVRYGYTFLAQKTAFMYKLIPALIENMGDAYPELKHQQTLIEKVVKEEEEAFLRTLETGMRLLDKVMDDTKKNGRTEISGVDAFTLYDTYGFPLDLTELILKENGLTLNHADFDTEMQKQKDRARNAAAVETGDWIALREGETEFVGYDTLTCESKILRYRKMVTKGKEFYQIVLDKTPFYAEMGGQVGDITVSVESYITGACPIRLSSARRTGRSF